MLKSHTCACIVLAAAGIAASATAEQGWKDKPIAKWSVENARQVLTESPWTKIVTPTADGLGGRQKVSMNPGGIGIGGVGIGVPGMGRRGGRGGQGRGSNDGANADSGQIPKLTLRWASAMPVSAAQVIVHELNAPPVDEEHYAIAVYGAPSRIVTGDPDSFGAELKKHAAIKRDGKKDIKPSSVEVLMLEEGPVFLYLFPRSNEIARKDQLKFDAEIGRLKFVQDFIPDEMVYQGKLEL